MLLFKVYIVFLCIKKGAIFIIMDKNQIEKDAIKKYLATPEIVLPYHSQNIDFTLTEFSGVCKICQGDTEKLRAHLTEHLQCLEIEGGGVCAACRCVTFFKARITKDGRLMYLSDKGWMQYRLKFGLGVRIKKAFKALLSRCRA